jgi:outer membrane immunogenic protein
VFGVEGDLAWIDKSGQHGDLNNSSFENFIKENWIDTLRGRVGYSFGNFFVYGTGGVAWVGAQMKVCDNFFQPLLCESQSTTRTGWTAGAGIEVSLAPNWSLKAEYLFADFGNTFFASQNEDFNNRNVYFNDNLLRIGLNYRFGWGPFGKGPANY